MIPAPIKSIFLKHLDIALLSPHSENARITLLIAALFVITVCLCKCQASFNAARANLLMGLFAGLLIPLLVLSASSSFEKYALQHLPTSFSKSSWADRLSQEIPTQVQSGQALVLASAVVAFLLIGIPLTRLLFQSGYLATLFSWLLSVFLALCVMAAIQFFVFHDEIWKDGLPLLKQHPRQFEKLLQE